jgi:hypothetical protein
LSFSCFREIGRLLRERSSEKEAGSRATSSRRTSCSGSRAGGGA